MSSSSQPNINGHEIISALAKTMFLTNIYNNNFSVTEVPTYFLDSLDFELK